MEKIGNEILDFIYRRWKDKNQSMLSGNCYWFAFILHERFPHLNICYLPVEGHFVCKDNSDGSLYDATGELNYNGPIISIDDLKECEPDWYNRLMRDCRD